MMLSILLGMAALFAFAQDKDLPSGSAGNIEQLDPSGAPTNSSTTLDPDPSCA